MRSVDVREVHLRHVDLQPGQEAVVERGRRRGGVVAGTVPVVEVTVLAGTETTQLSRNASILGGARYRRSAAAPRARLGSRTALARRVGAGGAWRRYGRRARTDRRSRRRRGRVPRQPAIVGGRVGDLLAAVQRVAGRRVPAEPQAEGRAVRRHDRRRGAGAEEEVVVGVEDGVGDARVDQLKTARRSRSPAPAAASARFARRARTRARTPRRSRGRSRAWTLPP